ncbi:MAG: transposase zinc-binding domain-containing protein [Pseudomonadota bacterium]|nr:transposase zinc-binding domain-containing protein [Pseudomonadota bacterium]
MVQDNLNTFLKIIELQDKPLPAHVVKEFLRVACTKCHDEKLVAFACRGRGFCPACMGRRMNETAVFLVDHVLPKLPIRQWVLSFPFPIRFILAKNPKHITKSHQIYLRVIDGFYIAQARTNEISGKINCAAVTAIQRFGGSVILTCTFTLSLPAEFLPLTVTVTLSHFLDSFQFLSPNVSFG